MPTLINEIPKVFLYGETLESEELNEIIDQINSAIRKLNNIENNLVNHGYSNIPITNIYCRTKKGINAINFFPLVDDKRNELLNLVSNCNSTQGIKYNINFSTVTISEDKDLMNGVWTAYPQGISASLPHEWEVSYKKLEDNSIIYVSGPVLYSNYGYNGTDGDSVQYIYKIFDHKLSGTEEEENTPFKPENPNSDGEYIPSGWKDNPQGPTREYPFEYVAILKKIKGNWEEKFEKISLWSTFSESGDFLTRVFCRYTPTQNKPAPNTPIGGTYNNPLPESNDNIQWSLTIPAEDDNNKGPIWTSVRIFKGTNEITEWSTPVIEADSAEIDIEYSSTMERPLLSTLRNIPNTAHPSNNIWHDPSETNIDLSTMVWRAERKIKNGQYIGNWIITKITGLRGDFKSFVFRRFKPTLEQLIPPTPTGGTYDNPIPDGGLWSDGLPPGNTSDGLIWVSSRTFTDNGIQSAWSTPRVLSDNDTLDIEFSPGIGSDHTLPNNPEGPPFTNREDSGWYDPSSINFSSAGTMFWRAERKVQNGQYLGGWVVTRIIGENGTDGNGFEYIFKGFSTEQTSWNTDSDDYPPKWINSDISAFLGDDYLGPTGHTWADDAIGVDDTNNKFVYVCSRKKYIDLGASKATWHTFSTPKLWALFVDLPSNGINGSYTQEVYRNDTAAILADLLNRPGQSGFDDINYPPNGWTTSPQERSSNQFTWCMQRTMGHNNLNIASAGPWGTPFRLTGDNGKNGEDGKYTEFIYKHFTSEKTFTNNDDNPHYWSTNDNELNSPDNPLREDYTGPSGKKWSDNPEGVEDPYLYEYMCQRTYDGTRYGPFTDPVLWSKYGENGRDGDGFEYIFKAYTSEQTSWDSNSDWYPPKWINSVNSTIFLGDDFRGPTGYLWEDDAIGVNNNSNKFVYVSSRRKYVDNGAERATWHTFSAPKLWAQYVPSIPGPTGKNGSHTLFIYKTTSANLNDSSNYTELTTANSGANTSEANVPYGWNVSSTNPSSTSELIWGTHRLIEYNSSNEPIYRHWHTPPYTVSGKNGNNGISLSSYILMLETWSDVVSVSGIYNEPTPNSGWSDGTPTNSNNYKYLWRRSRKMVLNSAGTDYEAETLNGVLTDEGKWKYMKLSGTDGTSIKVKGTVATVADLNNISNPSDGDAYKCEADGCIYVWSAEANSWVNLGQFKGDPGTTYYTHIAWASNVTLGNTPSGHTTTGLTTSPNASSVSLDFSISPFDGAAWMGTLVNTISTDSNDALAYTWVYVKGQPGATTATSVYQLVATVSAIRYKKNHASVIVWMPNQITLQLFKFEGSTFKEQANLPTGWTIKRTIDGDGTNTATVNNNSLGLVYASELASYSNNSTSVIGERVSIQVFDESNTMRAVLNLSIIREFLRMLIPMGAYVNKRYDMTDTTVPLVLGSDGKYYYLIADTNRVNDTNIDPTTDGQTVWAEATEYEVILTKALFADFAKLGSFIIYGDYFFSQYGTLYYNNNGNIEKTTINETNYSNQFGSKTPYGWFDPSDPLVRNNPDRGEYKFKPSRGINAKTGEDWGAAGNLHMEPLGDVYVNGTIISQGTSNSRWEISPEVYNSIAIPRIVGYSTNGNEKIVLVFDADDSDSYNVLYGGGLSFVRQELNTNVMAGGYFLNRWEIQCSNYGETDQNTHTPRYSYILCLPEHSDPRIHFYDNYNGVSNSLTIGVDYKGAYLKSSNWLSKANAYEGDTYVDDWGNLKVKRKSGYGYEQFNFVLGQNDGTNTITLPESTLLFPVPDGTMYFVKGNGSSTVRSVTPIMNSHNAYAWPKTGIYYANIIYGQSHTFLMQTVNGTKMWIDFYDSAQESPE